MENLDLGAANTRMATGERSAAKPLRIVFGLLVTVACLGYIFWTVDLDALVGAITGFDLRFAVLALAALALGYSFRIFRWALMLKGSAPHIRFTDCIAPFLGSIALNGVLPFRIGDAGGRDPEER